MSVRHTIPRHWIDENDTIHLMLMDVSDQRTVRVLLLCTNKLVPDWGMLATNYTYDPATCLLCIADEPVSVSTKEKQEDER